MDEIQNVETEDFETTTAETDFETEEGTGLGAVVIGAGIAAVGVCTAVAIKKRDKVKSFFEAKKEAAKQKKIEKLQKQLLELQAEQKPEAKEETEE